MAGRFRFTPLCCCGGEEPQGCFSPCIPACSVLFDGIFNTDDTNTPFMDLVAPSRLCDDGYNFWRGFYCSLSHILPIVDPSDTHAQTNNIVWAFGYSHGVRNSIQKTTDEQGHIINVYQTDAGSIFDFNNVGLHADWTYNDTYYPGITGLSLTNNNTAGFADYFVYSAVDGHYHYDPDEYEPVWQQLFATPYDFANCPFCFEMTEATSEQWVTAPSVLRTCLGSTYVPLSDCGFTRLTVYADFASDYDAREVSHTESYVTNYVTDGDAILTFLDGLIGAHATDAVPGVHHYGSGRFTLDYFGLRAPYQKISYSVSDNNITCPTGASSFWETFEGRYYLDAPDFTPMLPVDVYASDNSKTVPVDQSDPTQGTYTSYQKFGDRTVPVNLWSGQSTPWTEGQNGFLGDYIASARFYSYAPSIITSAAYTSRNSFLPFGKEWNGRLNLFGRQCRYRFPLGRYTFTLPSSLPSPLTDPSIRISTGPFFIYQLTLDKANYDFVWDDFNFIAAHYPSSLSGTYDEFFTDSLAILEQETISSDPDYDEPSGVLLGWKQGAVPASATETTPPTLVQYNRHVIYYKSDRLGANTYNQITGWGYGVANKIVNSVRSHFQTMGFVTSRSLGLGDLLASDTNVDNIPIPTGVNTCIGSYTLGWRTIANPDDGKTYIIPSVPQSVIADLMADAYVIVGYQTAEAGATYYYYPYIWITGYLVYNPDKHYPYENSGGNS